jgi:hypothetical protein
MDRNQLIERKQQVIAEIRRVRRELERERQGDSRRSAGRVRALESRLDDLMAEEYRLRLAIDRSR